MLSNRMIFYLTKNLFGTAVLFFSALILMITLRRRTKKLPLRPLPRPPYVHVNPHPNLHLDLPATYELHLHPVKRHSQRTRQDSSRSTPRTASSEQPPPAYTEQAPRNTGSVRRTGPPKAHKPSLGRLEEILESSKRTRPGPKEPHAPAGYRRYRFEPWRGRDSPVSTTLVRTRRIRDVTPETVPWADNNSNDRNMYLDGGAGGGK